MKSCIRATFSIMLLLFCAAVHASPPNPDQLIAEAQKVYLSKDFVGAQKLYLKAIELCDKQKLPPEKQVMLWSNLGASYREGANFEESENAFKRAISIAVASKLETGKTYANTLKQYAFLLRRLGNRAEADVLIKKAEFAEMTLIPRLPKSDQEKQSSSTRQSEQSHDGLNSLKWSFLNFHKVPMMERIGEAQVLSVAINPNGKTYAIARSSGWCEVLDIQNIDGRYPSAPAHKNWINGVAYSPDGSMIATGSSDGTVKLWDSRRLTLMRTLEGSPTPILSIAFSPDGSVIAAGSMVRLVGQKTQGEKLIRTWNVSSGQLLKEFGGENGSIQSVCFSPDGKSLAASGTGPAFSIWDFQKGIQLNSSYGIKAKATVCSVAFNPDGTIIATGDSSGNLSLWDVVSGKPLHNLTGKNLDNRKVAFAASGNVVAGCSRNGFVSFWEAAKGTEIGCIKSPLKWINSFAISPDEKLIVLVGPNGIEIWNIEGLSL